MFRTKTLTLVAIFLLECVVAHAGDDDASLRERFLKGVAEAAIKVKRQTIQAKYTMADEYPQGHRKSPPVQKSRCLFNDRFAKEMGDKNGIEFENVKNPEYAFSVAKSPGREKYSLNWLAQIGNATPEEERVIDEYVGGTCAMALGSWQLYGNFVWDLVQRPHFILKKTSVIRTTEGEYVRVDFEYLPTGNC